MEFKEVAATWSRICEDTYYCEECPLCGFKDVCDNGLHTTDPERVKEFEAYIQKWAEAHPVEKSEWVYACAKCGAKASHKYTKCPHCGAEMTNA